MMDINAVMQAEDLSHKAGKHIMRSSGGFFYSSCKSMNEFHEVARQQFMAGKARSTLMQQYILFAQRQKEAAARGETPRVQFVCGDNAAAEEAIWGPLYTHLPSSTSSIETSTFQHRFSLGIHVVDKSNVRNISSLIVLLKRSAQDMAPQTDGQRTIYFDAEWVLFTTSLDLLQLGTSEIVLLIRLSLVDMPIQVKRLLEDKAFRKVGACIGNDVNRAERNFATNFSNTLDLTTEAKDLVGDSTRWGVVGMANEFLGRTVKISGKFDAKARLSNWKNAKLTRVQQAYAATDVGVLVEIHAAMLERRAEKLDLQPPPPPPPLPLAAAPGGSTDQSKKRVKKDAVNRWGNSSQFNLHKMGLSTQDLIEAGNLVNTGTGAAAAELVSILADIDDDILNAFKEDGYHGFQDLTNVIGTSHFMYSLFMSAFRCIIYAWDEGTYTGLLQEIKEKDNISTEMAKFYLLRMRKQNPDKVKTLVRPPSQIIPDLEALWAACAHVRDPSVPGNRPLLDTPAIKKVWDTYIAKHRAGRYYDELPIDELYLSVRKSVRAEAERFITMRANSSPLEAFHFEEREVQGRSYNNGVILGSFLELGIMERWNTRAQIRNKGAFDYGYGIGKFHEFGLLSKIVEKIEKNPHFFASDQLAAFDKRYLQGIPIELETGERFAGLWRSPDYDGFKAGGKIGSALIDAVARRHAEVEDLQYTGESSETVMMRSDVNTLVSHFDKDFEDLLCGKGTSSDSAKAIVDLIDVNFASGVETEYCADASTGLTIGDLIRVAEVCLGRDLASTEKQSVLETYCSSASSEAATVGEHSTVTEVELEREWSKFMRLVEQDHQMPLNKMSQALNTVGKAQSQVYATEVQAVKKINLSVTEEQHSLFQDAWQVTSKQGIKIPSRTLLQKQYALMVEMNALDEDTPDKQDDYRAGLSMLPLSFGHYFEHVCGLIGRHQAVTKANAKSKLDAVFDKIREVRKETHVGHRPLLGSGAAQQDDDFASLVATQEAGEVTAAEQFADAAEAADAALHDSQDQHGGSANSSSALVFELPVQPSLVGAGAGASAGAGARAAINFEPPVETSPSTLVPLPFGILGDVGDLAGASAGYSGSSSAQAAVSMTYETLTSSLSSAALSFTASMGISSVPSLTTAAKTTQSTCWYCYVKKHFVNGNSLIAEGVYKNSQHYLNPTPMACENPLNKKSCREKAILSSLVGTGAGMAALKLVGTVKKKFSRVQKKSATTNNN